MALTCGATNACNSNNVTNGSTSSSTNISSSASTTTSTGARLTLVPALATAITLVLRTAVILAARTTSTRISVVVAVGAAAAATMALTGGGDIAQKWSMIGAVVLVHSSASPATRVASTAALLPAPVPADAAAAACASARVAPGSYATPTRAASSTPTKAVSVPLPPILAIVVRHGICALNLVLREIPSIHNLLSGLVLIKIGPSRAMSVHDASYEAAKASRCVRLSPATPTRVSQQSTRSARRGRLQKREEGK